MAVLPRTLRPFPPGPMSRHVGSRVEQKGSPSIERVPYDPAMETAGGGGGESEPGSGDDGTFG